MDLFGNDPGANLLPCDGTVQYSGPIFSQQESDRVFEALLREVPWKQDELVMFGKAIVTARKVAWYGDSTFDYAYSGTTKRALLWSDELLSIKSKVEKLTEETFNSCLLNLYHDGSEGMGWHSDDESSIVRESAIASVSFGAERIFRLKHRTRGETLSISLEHGSLLVMKGSTQRHWLHCIPKTKKIHSPRINLTFRTMMEGKRK
jgi:alkylated DNA repair dioxygenase AlkB